MSEGEIYPTQKSLELLDDFGRKRREEVQERTELPLPAFLESVAQSEVRYVFRPQDLPVSQISAAAFIKSVHDSYGAQIRDLDISPLLKSTPREELLSMDETTAIQKLVDTSNEVELRFAGGKFPLKFDFVPILSIRIDVESVTVSVAGISQVADTVAEEVVQLIWRSAGAARTWPQISDTRRLVAYGTATRISLPFPAEKLLSSILLRHVDNRFLSGEKFAAAMRSLSVRDGFEPSSAVLSSVNLADIRLKVSTFDPLNGSAEEQGIEFTVTARDDYGSGNIRITSTLNYDRHIKFIELLIRDLQEEE